MGRPINKKYFGQTNIAATGEGVGGEGVASVTISGVWSGYTQATTTVTFSAPQIPGGETATGTVTVTAGAPTAVTITNSGSGYTSAPTVTIADSDGGAETAGTATAVLTSGANARQNSITITARIPAQNTLGYVSGAGGSSAVTGEIIKQVGSTRYLVQTAQGIGRCNLVAKADGSLAAGEMNMVATDANGNTYHVTKLTAKRARLVRLVDDGSDGDWVHASNTNAQWSFSAASNLIVQIANR